MEDSVNYAEYTVDQKAEGKFGIKKKLFVLGYILFCVGGFAFFLSIGFYPIGTIWPFATFILVGFTWRYVQLEKKTEVVNAHFRISEIYGRKKQKTIFECLVSELSVIAPMDEAHQAQWETADTVIDHRGSVKAQDTYFARLEKDGKSTVVYFEAITKMVKVMKFYNSKNTVVTELRY